jgi:hypothetical protein
MQNSSRRSRGGLTNKEVLDLVRPVGSYFETDSATPPSTLWPWTTWEQVKDRVLIGAGNLYAVGDTGGEAKSPFQCAAAGYGLAQVAYYDDRTIVRKPAISGTAERDAEITNLPPYYATNIWRRTA